MTLATAFIAGAVTGISILVLVSYIATIGEDRKD